MVSGSSSKRARRWCFTINNPDMLHLPKDDVQGASFLEYQIEVGSNGTPHIQGIVCFTSAVTMSTVKTRFSNRTMHLEVMAGSFAQASHYVEKPVKDCQCKHCLKARTFPNDGRYLNCIPVSFGTPPNPGTRTDIHDAFTAIREGATEIEIAEAHSKTWLTYRSGLAAYRSMVTPKRNFLTRSLVLWGPPGSGKSKRAFEYSTSQYWLSKPNSNSGSLWFDGYQGEEVVIVDEFYGWLRKTDLQRILDRYPLTVQTKGSSTQFMSTLVIITSNSRPEDWYNEYPAALSRRISAPNGEVVYMGTDEFPDETSWLNSERYARSNHAATLANVGGDGAISSNYRSSIPDAQPPSLIPAWASE